MIIQVVTWGWNDYLKTAIAYNFVTSEHNYPSLVSLGTTTANGQQITNRVLIEPVRKESKLRFTNNDPNLHNEILLAVASVLCGANTETSEWKNERKALWHS